MPTTKVLQDLASESAHAGAAGDAVMTALPGAGPEVASAQVNAARLVRWVF